MDKRRFRMLLDGVRFVQGPYAEINGGLTKFDLRTPPPLWLQAVITRLLPALALFTFLTARLFRMLSMEHTALLRSLLLLFGVLEIFLSIICCLFQLFRDDSSGSQFSTICTLIHYALGCMAISFAAGSLVHWCAVLSFLNRMVGLIDDCVVWSDCDHASSPPNASLVWFLVALVLEALKLHILVITVSASRSDQAWYDERWRRVLSCPGELEALLGVQALAVKLEEASLECEVRRLGRRNSMSAQGQSSHSVDLSIFGSSHFDLCARLMRGQDGGASSPSWPAGPPMQLTSSRPGLGMGGPVLPASRKL